MKRKYVMNYRNIGSLKVSSVGMGCMGLSHASGAPLEMKQAIGVIADAYDMGYNFFDTAECYTGVYEDGSISYNEELVGAALKKVRSKVVIATKFGVKHAPDRSLIMDSRPETIRTSVEGSLKRLDTDYIDLYYQHRIDPNVEPEEVAEVMAKLIKEGKIREWGISEANEDYLRRANAVCRVSAVQNRYSMMARWHESLFPCLEELQIALVAFSPMANGFLTNCYDQNTKFEGSADYRADMPQYIKEGVERAEALRNMLSDLAERKNAAPAQISLAWMLCKKPWIIPIPGSRKPERLKENLASADIKLTDSEISMIDELLDHSDFLVFGGHKS